MEYLYVVSLLIGVCTLFFDVAATSYLPALVSCDDLLEANSASALSGAIASTAGPALAGGLVQILTAPVAIAIDAVSYLVSALRSGLIRAHEAPAPPELRGRRLMAEIGEGIGALINDPVRRPIIGASAVGSFGGSTRQAVLVPYRLLGRVIASRRFLVFGVIPLGALLGGALGQAYGLRAALVVGIAWQALCVLWLLLSPVRLLRDAPGPLTGSTVA